MVLSPLWFLLLIQTGSDTRSSSESMRLAATIDGIAAKHWQTNNLKPAPLADDATFLRRLTLDLAGRIPTCDEAVTYANNRAADKRSQAVRQLMQSPEYALNMGRVLDEIIQGKYAGTPEFLEYLRGAVAQHKSWDRVFRDVMLGPWDAKDVKGADRFLQRRVKSIDDLTTDTARVFFGVNVSCAKCHNHPLVPDWTQDHYYGMSSFFAGTVESGKGKNKGAIAEKAAAEVVFLTTKGERRTAKMMFLSSRVIDDPPGKTVPISLSKGGKAGLPKEILSSPRRDLLVKTALEEKSFFSRSIVNRLWAYFMGRGLVHPLDQMHSANPPSVPGLLEMLADDVAAHGYNLDRLVAAIVLSRVYQLSSAAAGDAQEDSEKDFNRAQLRPLTPYQFAISLALATGDRKFDQAGTTEPRARRYRDLEGQVTGLVKLDFLDPRSERFQSSTGEALFMSNNPDVQRYFAPSGKNLVARLASMTDTGTVVDTAVWTVLSRAPEKEERAYLIGWLQGQKTSRAKACSDMLWALATSAEFRFNH